MNTDNIDRYGHCVICHANLINKRVVDGKVIDMFSPLHGHTTFLLDSGSQMQVCMCLPCQKKVDLTDPVIHENIMEACLKGWELETKQLIENKTWEQKHGEEYLKNMAILNIDCHSENLDNDAKQSRIKELVEVKNVSHKRP